VCVCTGLYVILSDFLSSVVGESGDAKKHLLAARQGSQGAAIEPPRDVLLDQDDPHRRHKSGQVSTDAGNQEGMI
jgi:hypothetical protein